MAWYEGILLTWNTHLNAAAVGALLEEDSIELKIYNPSDSAKNLKENNRFTFSLTDDPYLFYKAALTGHDTINFMEFEEDEIETEGEFFYPKKAARVHLCEVLEFNEVEIQDELGHSIVTNVSGHIIEKIGHGDYIQREDPRVDAMVHASRIPLAEGEYKKRLKEKIYKILKNQNDDLADKILKYIEGY